METFIQFIQTLGFPIAIAVYLLYDRSKADQLHKDEMDAMRKEMENSNAKMTEALNNNTNVLSRILEVLHVGNGES
jgi:hypothetical protein